MIEVREPGLEFRGNSGEGKQGKLEVRSNWMQ